MKKVLIADDIEENLYLLNLLLKSNGYTVIQACNGSEAIVQALNTPPDLIITDILMPVIDGFTLCRIWKADERLSRIPFIFYTATYTDPRDERLAFDMGADGFIIKPAEPDVFMREIEDILEQHRNGTLPASRGTGTGEDVILKNYNEVLTNKLEHKMARLESINRELTTALKEKETLLAEIHHRVKNNMQVINSLISLQLLRNINSMSAEEIASVARELQDRIRSMMLVHEMLYSSKNFSKINIGDYVRTLMNKLIATYCIDTTRISTIINIPDEFVDIVLAIPFGLIVSEVLTNALKYAFPEERKGTIRIRLEQVDDDRRQLIIHDDGIGLPESFSIDTIRTMGMNLVAILCEQIRGSMQIHNDSGTFFSLLFSKDHGSKNGDQIEQAQT
jgi:two-component sensor histidine kinase